MIIETRPLAEITRDAIDLLYRELGVVEAVRFLNQFTTGYGDYTVERRRLFDHLTVDEIVAAIETERDKTSK